MSSSDNHSCKVTVISAVDFCYRTPFGLRRCPNDSKRPPIWNRDTNAAINIA